MGQKTSLDFNDRVRRFMRLRLKVYDSDSMAKGIRFSVAAPRIDSAVGEARNTSEVPRLITGNGLGDTGPYSDVGSVYLCIQAGSEGQVAR